MRLTTGNVVDFGIIVGNYNKYFIKLHACRLSLNTSWPNILVHWLAFSTFFHSHIVLIHSVLSTLSFSSFPQCLSHCLSLFSLLLNFERNRHDLRKILCWQLGPSIYFVVTSNNLVKPVGVKRGKQGFNISHDKVIKGERKEDRLKMRFEGH